MNSYVDIELEDYSAFTIFLVGVGGIGCEILKYLSKFTFKEVHIVDLDTIELSNLNRQFYFKPEHIGRPKSMVAAEVFSKISPNLKIIAYQENIFSDFFNQQFYSQMDFVLLALDNQEARSYVNKCCVKASVPILESGTFGFIGQTYPIFPKISRCYDCFPRPTNESGVQICTIRTNPTKPEHCLFWAKNIFNNLFDETMKDDSFRIVDSLNGKPLEEALESFKDLIVKLFFQNIVDQKLSCELKFGHLLEIDKQSISESFFEFLKFNFDENNCIEEQKIRSSDGSVNSLFLLFKDLLSKKTTFTFDKDDDTHVEFVRIFSNLRCSNFGIPLQTFDDVRSKIGQIVPAVCSTNSLVAGLLVQELLKYFLKVIRFKNLEAKRNAKFTSLDEFILEIDGEFKEILLSFQNFESYVSNSSVLKLIRGQMNFPFEDCSICQRERVFFDLNFKSSFRSLQLSLEEKFGNDFTLFFNNNVILEKSSDQTQINDSDPDDDHLKEQVSILDIPVSEVFKSGKLIEIEALLLVENVLEEKNENQESCQKSILVSLINNPSFVAEQVNFRADNPEKNPYFLLWKAILDLRFCLNIKKKEKNRESDRKIDVAAPCLSILEESDNDLQNSFRSIEITSVTKFQNGKRV